MDTTDLQVEKAIEEFSSVFKSPGRLYLWRRSLWYFWQRRTRGWDDSVTWNLNDEIIAFIAPRLRRFRELNDGYPGNMSEESWNAELDEMCWSVDWFVEHAYDPDLSKDRDRADRGIKLLFEKLPCLWW